MTSLGGAGGGQLLTAVTFTPSCKTILKRVWGIWRGGSGVAVRRPVFLSHLT